jgi:uncharacterized membrane protein
MDAHALSVVVRWLHVLAMAVALGGSALIALAIRSSRSDATELLVAYERAFWIAAGVLAMTGVGNAASFGIELPAPASAWGATFTLKLVSVVGLALFSLPRSIVVARLENGAHADASRALLANLYRGTALWLVLTLALAVWLSHG